MSWTGYFLNYMFFVEFIPLWYITLSIAVVKAVMNLQVS